MTIPTNYPDNFLLANQESSKTLNVVVQIDGVPDLITSGPLFTKVRYGDPGIVYGEPGIVYGGLRQILSGVKNYLSLDGSLTISQKVEPEQGRGAITLLSLAFVDKDGYFSKLISPGVIVDEPLGNKFVKVYLGYKNTSFPEDYVTILRGYISGTTYTPGKVTLQLADPNLKRRGQVFFTQKSSLTAGIDNIQTTIPVQDTASFYQAILGPNGSYDPAVTTYIKIDDEFMEYGPAGITSPTSITVTRGARGTTAAPHDITTDVDNYIQIQDNLVNLALKIMLSGWNGPAVTGETCRSIVNTLDPVLGNVANSILLKENKDAVLDYGLQPNDWVTISGSGAGNNGTYQITDIRDALSRTNRLLIVSGGPLNVESPATGVTLAFRSQFDTLPVNCGSKMQPQEVDVFTHISTRNQYLGQNENRMQFLIKEPFSAKTFIETELFLPVGAYSLTRYGQVSMTLTKPPIADQKFITLSKDNITDISTYQVVRALNNRRYFNEVQYQFDLADDLSTFQNVLSIIDTESLTKVSISTPLPIASKGLKTSLGATSLIERRGKFLLRRYAKAAFEISFKTNFETISQLEAGDVVLLKDDGTLHIVNFDDGTRNIQTQLFEVIERSLDIKSGNGQIKLLSSLGVQITDRFATISPSSHIVAGSTTSGVIITESFGALYPGNEQKKWAPYVGLPVYYHNDDFSVISEETTFTGIDPGNDHRLLMNPPFITAPTAGMTLEIAKYDTGSDPNHNRLYKIVHAYLDPSIQIVSGIDNFNFTVSLTDVVKFNTDGLAGVITIHNSDYTISSPEVQIQSVNTGTGQVTVASSLGFTPAAGQIAELVGFKDGGGAYRFI